MAEYTFTMDEDFSDDETTDTKNVVVQFDAEFLPDLAEKFYFFLKASGYDYVTGVRIAKGADNDAVEFTPY